MKNFIIGIVLAGTCLFGVSTTEAAHRRPVRGAVAAVAKARVVRGVAGRVLSVRPVRALFGCGR